MKSSRQRFAEFRDKIKKGLLDPTRFADPNKKGDPDPVNTGGHHRYGPGGAGPPAGKHIFKHKRKQLLAEYRIMLKGYYRPVIFLLLISLGVSILTLVMPIAIKVLVDDIAVDRPLNLSPFLAHWPAAPVPHACHHLSIAHGDRRLPDRHRDHLYCPRLA